MKYDSLAQTATLSLATAIEAIAGGLIAPAVANAVVFSPRALRRSGAGGREMHAARELMGNWLSLRVGCGVVFAAAALPGPAPSPAIAPTRAPGARP
jgi:hypothetical protein